MIRWLILAAALAAAAGAQAQAAAGTLATAATHPAAGAPALDLSDPHAFLTRPYGESRAGEESATPRTEVDHRFTPDGLFGAAGYLCGAEAFAPGAGGDPAGGPSSGLVRRGTFLGARLGYAFR